MEMIAAARAPFSYPISISIAKLFFFHSSPFFSLRRRLILATTTTTTTASPFLHHPPSTLLAAARSIASFAATPPKPKNEKNPPKKKKSEKLSHVDTSVSGGAKAARAAAKRRTRSEKELDRERVECHVEGGGHIPVMIGEVLDVFSSPSAPLRSFIDCTLGAAGHSSAIIQAHPQLELFIGLDVDPIAHEIARGRINSFSHGDSSGAASQLKAHTLLKNFRFIKTVLSEISHQYYTSGVDGILMDLGMSSMQVDDAARGFSLLSSGPLDMRMDPQAPLKAEDILNCWPDIEVGQILREYGEESNWWSLQKKIIKARLDGGLHSTGELVELIQRATPRTKGRQGWIKTATRVFQALRIAVNDELKTLEDALYASFDCLAPGGRLAVISFHSLEDRIVKQTFLNIVNRNSKDGDESEGEESRRDLGKSVNGDDSKERWIKQMVWGSNGIILTKRPITPSEEEERLNRRCRSAKLRVIEKVCR